jgi:hypothetical protein
MSHREGVRKVKKSVTYYLNDPLMMFCLELPQEMFTNGGKVVKGDISTEQKH